MTAVKIYFRKPYALQVIKAHSPRLFTVGIRAKDLYEIAKKMGFAAKDRGTYEQHLNNLVTDGVLKETGTKVGGCTVFALVDKTIIGDIARMRSIPLGVRRKAEANARQRHQPKSVRQTVTDAARRVISRYRSLQGDIEALETALKK